MKNSRHITIKKFLCKQTKTKLEKKERKLYLIFLHEDLYSLTNEEKWKDELKNKSRKENQKNTFLTTKRCISQFIFPYLFIR